MNHQEPSGPNGAIHGRTAYRAALALIAAAIFVTLLFLIVPRVAGAFWPFTVSRAQVADTLPHDSGMTLLAAAINADPNPEKKADTPSTTGDVALIANVGPDGSIVETKGSTSRGGQISTYTVQEGDSLSEIASRYGVTVNTILWANELKSANLVRPGDELLILPVSGLQYTVRSGDTIGGIAKKYDADPEEIAIFNGLESSAALIAGSDIIIPGGSMPTKTTKAASSGSKTSAASSKALPAISGFFGNPLPGGRLSQGIHGYNGVDIAAPSGTPIYAAAAGSIVVARNNGGYNGGYGNYIVINHGNGTQTLYAHMSKTAVSGGSVAKGDLIGYVGNTGRSTGNHLHFEVRGAKNPFAN